MADETKMIILDPNKENGGDEGKKKNNKTKYIIYAIIIFIAVFIYDVSPIDLIPLVPIDDIAVTGGGLMGILLLILKYYKKDKPNK